jgi:hypothetical protein
MLDFQRYKLRAITDDEHGFKIGYFTTLRLFLDTEHTTYGFNNNKLIMTLFVDSERTFSKVRTRGIIAKYEQCICYT